MDKAQFRFYEELNDFLPSEKRKRDFIYEFTGRPAVKDAIEALGVPHTEVDLILVNGRSVDFAYQLDNNDRVSVYPVFESLDVSSIIHLRDKPLREIRFICDVNLGKLARYLRLLGFDTEYHNHLTDQEIVRKSVEDNRIVLTRDIGVLKNKKVTHGYWLRSTDPLIQTREIIQRFDLKNKIKPFQRCLECNHLLKEIDREAVLNRVPQKVRDYYDQFYCCSGCSRIYWKGSHYDRLAEKVKGLLA